MSADPKLRCVLVDSQTQSSKTVWMHVLPRTGELFSQGGSRSRVIEIEHGQVGGIRITLAPADAAAITPEVQSLIESLHRKVDEARTESEKADAEALHWKTRHAEAMAENWKANYAVMKQWENRALEAEARLAGLEK